MNIEYILSFSVSSSFKLLRCPGDGTKSFMTFFLFAMLINVCAQFFYHAKLRKNFQKLLQRQGMAFNSKIIIYIKPIIFYTFVYNTRNMKTITISDEIYEKLLRIKEKKSFSAVIDELIKRNVEKRVEMLIKSAERTGYEDELERTSEEIRKSFRVRF